MISKQAALLEEMELFREGLAGAVVEQEHQQAQQGQHAQLEQQHAAEVAALKAAHGAELAELREAHCAEVARVLTSAIFSGVRRRAEREAAAACAWQAASIDSVGLRAMLGGAPLDILHWLSPNGPAPAADAFPPPPTLPRTAAQEAFAGVPFAVATASGPAGGSGTPRHAASQQAQQQLSARGAAASQKPLGSPSCRITSASAAAGPRTSARRCLVPQGSPCQEGGSGTPRSSAATYATAAAAAGAAGAAAAGGGVGSAASSPARSPDRSPLQLGASVARTRPWGANSPLPSPSSRADVERMVALLEEALEEVDRWGISRDASSLCFVG